MSKQESFIKGTIILAAAALVARVLGLVQRVPLEHILGSVGNASYTIANTTYLLLLTVATAGIPSTLSKMVSERYALQRPSEAKRVYHAALIFAVVIGVIMTVLLYVLAPAYANYSKEPEAAGAIRAVAPALLLFPAIAMMRGYFQGRGMMAANGISQIMEQILRVITGVGLAFVLLHAGYADQEIAAGASFGGVLGSVGAFIIMLYYSMKLKRDDRKLQLEDLAIGNEPLPMGRIYMDIFKLSIPIVLSSLAVPAVYAIDSTLVKPLLISQIGNDLATHTLGILGSRAQSIAGIPPILSIALSASLLPVIAAAFARNDRPHMERQITLAMRVSILTGMPIVIILCSAAYSLNAMIFSTRDGSGIIALLTLGTIFQITMSTSSSILIGMNKVKVSMFNVIIGIAVKLVGSFALAPFFGVYGIIVSTGLCFLVITLLNLRKVKIMVPFSILKGRWAGFLITIALLYGAGYSLNQLGVWIVDHTSWYPRVIFFLICCVVGLVIMALYPVMLVILRVVRKDELASYPRVLQKVLRPLMRLQRGTDATSGL
ncbi:stage V sporulation protein B [Paenibacillus shirakamiensis]|uniref:Stage V sporulation protein B n=1 Tax=Paenibacillus shirakamiensis TaxID=1265935 RepID=A0ABS4JK26_9BACL|nr:polysaccharide biosynthesis protein [Paenibacillus shirakamiensis]MBP2002063.1 stage V sporulation protein B [Paenibacillus shirakamiensis]